MSTTTDVNTPTGPTTTTRNPPTDGVSTVDPSIMLPLLTEDLALQPAQLVVMTYLRMKPVPDSNGLFDIPAAESWLVSMPNTELRKLSADPGLCNQLMSAIFAAQTQVEGDVMAFKDALVKQEEQELKERAAREKAAQEAAEEMRLKEQAKREEEECAKREEEERAKREEEERARKAEEIKAKGQDGAGTERNGDGGEGKDEQTPYGKIYPAGGPCDLCVTRNLVCVGQDGETCMQCKSSHMGCSNNTTRPKIRPMKFEKAESTTPSGKTTGASGKAAGASGKATGASGKATGASGKATGSGKAAGASGKVAGASGKAAGASGKGNATVSAAKDDVAPIPRPTRTQPKRKFTVVEDSDDDSVMGLRQQKKPRITSFRDSFVSEATDFIGQMAMSIVMVERNISRIKEELAEFTAFLKGDKECFPERR